MRIDRNEFLKLFTRKSIILVFLIIVLLNAGLVLNNMYGKTDKIVLSSPYDYKKIYKEISGLSNDEALKTLNNKLENLNKNSNNSSADNQVYTNHRAKQYLLQEIILEVNQCKDYGEYLNGINTNFELSGKIGAFSKADKFSYRNISKTKIDFEHMKGTTIRSGPSKGITTATEFIGTDILGVLLIVFVIITLITRERELYQLQLVKSMYKGRTRLAVSKLLIIFICCIIVEFLLYSTNFAITGLSYGFGDLSRPIQSVTGYLSCNIKVTVLEYLIIFLLSKLLVYFIIATFVYFIAVISKNSLKLYIIVFATLGISAICYYTIEPTSWLSLLKYINIIAFLNTSQVFSKYLNLNFFNYPINYVTVFIIFLLVLLLVFSYLSIVIFSEQKEANNISKKFFIKLMFIKTYKTTSIFSHECYKTFISGKSLLIIFAFGLIAFCTYKPIVQDYQTSDGYYKAYMKILEGPVNQDRLDYIKQERARFDELRDKMNADLDNSDDNRDTQLINAMYDNLLKPESSFIQVENHTQYLVKQIGNYLFDDGYKLLTGHQCAHNKDVKLAIIAMLITICSITYIYSIEYETKANVLQHSAYKGRRQTFVCKFIIALIIVTIIYLLTYAPYFYNVLSKYGTSSINAPACSMEHLSSIPRSISILEYLIIISVMRYMGMILSVFLIFYISIKVKSYISSIIINTAVFIIPLVIYLAGVSVFKYVLLNPLLLGNVN